MWDADEAAAANCCSQNVVNESAPYLPILQNIHDYLVSTELLPF